MTDIRAAALAAAIGGDIKDIRQTQGALGEAIETAQADAVSAKRAAGKLPIDLEIDGPVIVPRDFPTILAALQAFGPNRIESIEIRIEAGHVLAQGLSLTGGDYSAYRITSADATVPLSPGFSGNVFAGYDAAMPVLDCVVDAANQIAGQGIALEGQATMTIKPGKGVRNSWGTGLATRYGAKATYDGADFSGGGRNGNTGASVTIWGGAGSGEGLNVRNSKYYGAQSAHGSVANYKSADASGASRYGFRASDGSVIDLDGCVATDAGVEAVRIFNGCLGNIVGFQGARAQDKGISVSNGSLANVNGGCDFTLAVNYGGYVAGGSSACFTDAKLRGAGIAGLYVGAAGTAYAGGVNARRNGENGADTTADFVVATGGILALSATSVGGVSQQPNKALPGGIIFDPRPWTVAPLALNASVNDYDSPRPDLRDVVPLLPNAFRSITGVARGFTGARLTLFNTSTDHIIALTHQDALSQAANRFVLPGYQSFFIYPGASVTICYLNDRWHLVGHTGAPQVPTYTVATLPPPASRTRTTAYVSNAAGGATLAYSDGTNWRRADDNAVVG